MLPNICLTARMLTKMCMVMVFFITACSGGSDNSNPPPTSGPPGNTTPLITGQPGRFDAPITAMVPVPNGHGDIYVAGHFTTYNDQRVRPVVRLKPDGSLDQTFQLTEAVVAPAPNIQITAIAAADDGSGDLYVGEHHSSFNAPDDGPHVWKVTSTGALAPAFTSGVLRNTVVMLPGPQTLSAQLYDMAPVGDGSGRVYVGGLFNRYNDTSILHLFRLNTNGTVDTTFGALNPIVRKLLVAKDGSGDIYVMTYGQVGPSSFAPLSVERRNADGTLDPAFVSFRPVDGRPSSFTLAEDGSGDLFVTGGFIRVPENTIVARPGFVRLNPDGSLDESTPRLNSDGSPDPTSTWPQVMFPKFLAQAKDGTNDWFVVRGVLTDGVITSDQLQRHKADGTLDVNFSPGQATGVDASTQQCVCAGINLVMPAPDSTGDVYIAGGFTTYNSTSVRHIVRINPNGTLD